MNKTFDYLKKNSAFIYSLILMILIPVLIVANIIWQIRSGNNIQVTEQKSKAILVGNVLASTIDITTDSPASIQAKLQKISQENKEISEITILEPETNGFTAIASTNKQNLGLKFTSEDYVNAFSNDTPTVTITKDNTKNSTVRYLNNNIQIKDSLTGKKSALASIKISLADIDAANQKYLSTSRIILIITVFLVLLLLINHLRFYELAVSFRKLDEVDKMKDEFISIASHEMKTPIAAIKGYISMLNEGLVGKFDDKTKAHLDKIETNVMRLDQLLGETLDVSRLEQGRMQFDMKPFDISKIITQTMQIMGDQARAKNLQFREIKLNQMPLVFVDPLRLQQVVDNIVGNAAKYTQKGGITISYKIESGNLLTSIRDTGIGMNSEDQKRLFTKFYRVKNEKTVDIPGTGLGLWISREIVRKMNGDITVNSQENVGTEFIIRLPYVKEK